MTELSNVVTVLIARMESHPEDFEMYTGKRCKFAGTAEALYGLVGLDKDKQDYFWYLSDADKEALIAAWKKYHLIKFERDVMETIFDDGHEEREREAEMQKLKMQMYQQAHQQRMQNQMLNSTMPQPVTGLNNAAMNSTSSTGLFGSASQAFSGIFK